MRWGVRDEATDDHMTTELCMKEIENCQRLSMGPNFVVSISDSCFSNLGLSCFCGHQNCHLACLWDKLGLDKRVIKPQNFAV